METSDSLMALYDVLNAVLRGIVSAKGGGGGITCELYTVKGQITVTDTENLLAEIYDRCECFTIEDGDIISITSSIVAYAQGRIVPLDAIPKQYGQRGAIPTLMNDTCLRELASNVGSAYDIHCSTIDILLSDTVTIGGDTAILLAPERPNQVAHQFSQLVMTKSGKLVDTVIKDSDAGARKGIAVIGAGTLVATPLASTKGLSILDAMRVAAASEVLMGKKNVVPVVLSRPANRVVKNRLGIGEGRKHAFLNAAYEPLGSSYEERD